MDCILRLRDRRRLSSARWVSILLVAAFAWPMVGRAATTTNYVATTGGDGNSGTSWATAWASITNAVAQAADGALVLVSNGTYDVSQEVIVTNGITLQGVNGPDNTIIRRNSTTAFRVLQLNHANAALSGLTFANGYARYSHGGGVYLLNGLVTNCVMTGNTSYRGTPGIYATGGLVTHCTIRGNYDAGNSGTTGGARLGTGGTMEYCLITGNTGGYDANGACGLQLNGVCVARYCIISNNTTRAAAASPDNAVILNNGGVLENSLVVDHPLRGVYVDTGGTGGTLRNCTISGNSRAAAANGNGVYLREGTIENCVVYGNNVAAYVSDHRNVYVETGTVRYTCTTPAIAGTGNTSAAPRFVDPASGDYRLLPGSPCIDTGTNLTAMATDLDGNARRMDGDGDAQADQDMGAYEALTADSGALRCGFTASVQEGVGTLAVTFTAYVAGTNTTITSYHWDLGDGTLTNGAALSSLKHTYGPGRYTVSLTVTNALGLSASATVTNDIQVGAAVTYVATTGSHSFPYDTWARAANDVLSAVDATLTTNASELVVWVTNGSYDAAVSISIQKPLRVQSVNGPTKTGVRRSGAAAYSVFTLADDSIVISGLSISNGYVSYAQGAAVYMSPGGTLTNCIIAANSSNRGSMLYASGGLITHSRIEGNTESGNSGGCGGVKLAGGAVMEWSVVNYNRPGSEGNGVSAITMMGNCTVRNCAITNSRAYSETKESTAVAMASGDVLQNCLLVDNPVRGLQVNGGTVENCTITRNTVYGDSGNGAKLLSGTIRNTILWDNGTDNLQNLDQTGGTVEFTDVNPAVTGTGNKNQDPVFSAPADGDYHLDPASPCIDAGTNQTWMTDAVTVELDGTNRVVHGSVDMGCYEAPAPSAGSLACNFDAEATEGFADFAAVFTASAVGGNTNIVYYGWDFGDSQATEGPGKGTVTNTYAVAGYYDVSLTVSNSGGQTAEIAKPAFIYVAPIVAYVSTGGLHQAPFSTWRNASTNLQDAVSVARVIGPDATRVLVSNGTYITASQVELGKGITVESVNGWSNTVVARSSAGVKLFWIHDTNAVLDGLSISNGYAGAQSQPGGMTLEGGTVKNCLFVRNSGNRSAAVVMTDGVISNCVIRHSRDAGNSGNTGGIKLSGGVLVDSVIRDNNGGNEGGGSVGGVRLSGAGKVVNCVISGNTFGGIEELAGGAYIAGGLMRNCLISGNDNKGIRMAGGVLESCTIVRNSGDGIDMSGGWATNTIVYYNNSGAGDIVGTAPDFSFSCSPDLTPGVSDNITSVPLFEAPGSGYGSGSSGGDYRLKISSLCLDAGTERPWMASGIDLAGNARILNEAPDMGAYETYRPPRSTVVIIR